MPKLAEELMFYTSFPILLVQSRPAESLQRRNRTTPASHCQDPNKPKLKLLRAALLQSSRSRILLL